MGESHNTQRLTETLIRIAWRNIWRNKRRTSLCVIACSIAVFFNIFMHSWIDGMIQGIERVVQTYETGHILAVSQGYHQNREYLPVQFPLGDGRPGTELLREVESIDGVQTVLPRISTYASLFDNVKKHAVLWGIDIDRERQAHALNLTTKSDGLIKGRFPMPGENACAVGYAFSRKSGLTIGQHVPLKTVSEQFSDKYWSPEIVGIFRFDYRRFDEDAILVSIDRLQRILGLTQSIQQLVIYTDSPDSLVSIEQNIKRKLGELTIVTSWTDNYWVAMFRSMSGMFLIVFAVFQIVASFLIINTMVMIIHERIKEIGMMGALGMNRTEIVMVFFLEALMLSVLGSLVGMIIGGQSSWIASLYPLDMNTFTGGGMKDLPMAGTLYLAFSWITCIKGFLFGIGVSALCTLFPSMKSAFIEPVEALRR